MYNRLLFDCPQLSLDVIFAAVSNQCPQRPPVRETLPTLKLQQKVRSKTRKEAFLKKLGVASRIFDFLGTQLGSSFLLTVR
jgi:hypothetical protein